MKQLGFNFFLTLEGKTLAGETQSDMNVSATEKSSLTKADKGNAQTMISGHEVAFNVNGVMEVNEDGEATALDSDELLERALKVGEEAKIPFTYTRGSGKSYTGNIVISSYSESTNAEGEATYSLSVKVSGEMKPVDEE